MNKCCCLVGGALEKCASKNVLQLYNCHQSTAHNTIKVQANYCKLVDASSSIVTFSCVLLTITVLLHYIFAAIVRIDVDTLIITSTASVMGPASVGPITESIDNRDVLLSGLTTGLVGYAVGNYLGLLIAQLL